jgi:hypothetical protein
VLRVSQQDGVQYWCQMCQTVILEIEQAVGLHRPLTGPMDHADVLILHASCRHAPLVTMLLPSHVKRPLAELLAQADEAVNR